MLNLRLTERFLGEGNSLANLKAPGHEPLGGPDRFLLTHFLSDYQAFFRVALCDQMATGVTLLVDLYSVNGLMSIEDTINICGSCALVSFFTIPSDRGFRTGQKSGRTNTP